MGLHGLLPYLWEGSQRDELVSLSLLTEADEGLTVDHIPLF
jgi:hypothetical protein